MQVNIGFAGAPVNENLFESLFFRRTKIGLVAGKKHRFAKRGSITLHELRDEQLIVLNDNRNLIDFCSRNDIKPRVRLSLAELDLVSELCASGRMACFLGDSAATNLAGLNYIDIEGGELYFETHLIANRNIHKSAAAEKFIAYAKNNCLTGSFHPPPDGASCRLNARLGYFYHRVKKNAIFKYQIMRKTTLFTLHYSLILAQTPIIKGSYPL